MASAEVVLTENDIPGACLYLSPLRAIQYHNCDDSSALKTITVSGYTGRKVGTSKGWISAQRAATNSGQKLLEYAHAAFQYYIATIREKHLSCLHARGAHRSKCTRFNGDTCCGRKKCTPDVGREVIITNYIPRAL